MDSKRARIIFIVLALVFSGSLSGCAKRFDIVTDQRVLDAYGKKWVYSVIEHRSQTWGFYTGHGFIGRVDRVRQEITIESDGRGLKVPQIIYALQEDGTYRRVNCCYDFNTLAAVYEKEGKLFVHFLQKKRNVTNCSLGGSIDEGRMWVDFFGEFDPETRFFYVRSSANKEVKLDLVMGPDWKQLLQKESIEEATKREFRYRKPFDCKKGQ